MFVDMTQVKFQKQSGPIDCHRFFKRILMCSLYLWHFSAESPWLLYFLTLCPPKFHDDLHHKPPKGFSTQSGFRPWRLNESLDWRSDKQIYFSAWMYIWSIYQIHLFRWFVLVTAMLGSCRYHRNERSWSSLDFHSGHTAGGSSSSNDCSVERGKTFDCLEVLPSAQICTSLCR